MSEENENSDREENEEKEENEDNDGKEENEEKEEKENFSTYEDNLITLLNKLSETIETFNTLSREQAENAILETNIKINNCKETLKKMEEFINKLKNEDEEKAKLNKKLLNYKTEYQEILNKYKEIQDNYINKKTENALMEENLIDEDNNRNSIRITTGTVGTNNINALGAGNPHMIDGELEDEKSKKYDKNIRKENENDIKVINNTKNNERNKVIDNNTKNEISLIMVSNNNHLGYSLNPNKEKEETFHEINQDYDKKKKIIIIVCVVICIIIFFLIFLIALFS